MNDFKIRLVTPNITSFMSFVSQGRVSDLNSHHQDGTPPQTTTAFEIRKRRPEARVDFPAVPNYPRLDVPRPSHVAFRQRAQKFIDEMSFSYAFASADA